MQSEKYFKVLLAILCMLWVCEAKATNYYLSDSGNDANKGTTSSSAWKTLERLNSFKNLQPGDSILFRRGDVFYGTITVHSSGRYDNPIVYSAYGEGDKPVITGFTYVGEWKKSEKNIWESVQDVSDLPGCNLVNIDGVNAHMGRYPNSGYLSIPMASGDTSITDASLKDTDWTGADVVIKKVRFAIERNPVTSQSGNTIRFKKTSSYAVSKGWGYFIQNHIQTLDTTNEWYFDPGVKRLYIYSEKKPQNVKVASVDTLVIVLVKNYITFEDIRFSGSNKDAVVVGSSNNITIQNCDFEFSGGNAIEGRTYWQAYHSDHFRIISNTFSNTNNYGVHLELQNRYAYIGYNTFEHTSMIAGVNEPGGAQGIALMAVGDSTIIEHNIIRSSGYSAVFFGGDHTIVKNNFIDGFCKIRDDGGGIYTWVNNLQNAYYGQKVLNNIVINGRGNRDGTGDKDPEIWINGIYLDNRTSFTEVAGNTVANCDRAGLFPYRGVGNNLHHNLCYNNKYGLRFQDDLGTTMNDTVMHNIFISKTDDQFPAAFDAPKNNIANFGLIDSNYYIRPVGNSFVIRTKTGSKYETDVYTLKHWQYAYHFDQHSMTSPLSIPSYSYIQTGRNRVENSSFKTSISGVSSWSANNNLIAAWNNNKMAGGSLQLSYQKISASNTKPVFSLPVGAVESSKQYILKFSCLSQLSNKTIYAYLKKAGNPYQELTARLPAVITSDIINNEILISFPKSAASAVLMFTWNDKDLNEPFWINNIQLFEATITRTDQDKFILFRYNASSTDETIPLTENYVDATGKTYQGHVILKPFQAIVLMKKEKR